MLLLTKFIFNKLLKWKVVGNTNLLKKCVIIAAPHTHWQDLFIALMARKVMQQEINFIGKKELFNFPLGFFFKMMGGKPVERNSKSNNVKLIANVFKDNDLFRLALSPEGTRKKVNKWKTGFYYIAKEANVPIISASLNFKDKEIKISDPYYITGDIDKDIKHLKLFFKGIKGRVPECS
ncbi:MAG: 1-acyl-sn-glycerol-3-phosphate acyltransferase [Flavobacteriales bacterium]|jgi:1-acyl-sn-glycerol-3-phosphate acyltransferase|tara:strand:+ start:9105 stop:9641 length:537 start_codon:yes stop_codon:yes gene_type:complete